VNRDWIDGYKAGVEDSTTWISVKETLPSEDGRYLVVRNLFDRSQWIQTLWYTKQYDGFEEHLKGKAIWYDYDSEWGDCEADNVTHWMTLPGLPREEVLR
jgi:hypothetical protein